MAAPIQRSPATDGCTRRRLQEPQPPVGASLSDAPMHDAPAQDDGSTHARYLRSLPLRTWPRREAILRRIGVALRPRS